MRIFATLALLLTACSAEASGVSCENVEWRGTPATVCEVGEGADLRLFLRGADARPIREFSALKAELAKTGERLVFATNAGMYHRDRSPVGLHVENGREVSGLVLGGGPGNFHMLPNGVFWVGADGRARVTQTLEFAALPEAATAAMTLATQSGPMLVVDGELHPRFLPTGTSRKVRNGVGVTDGGVVVFAVSDRPINFHDFATLFRDGLGVPNALYLDGTVSRMYLDGERSDGGLAMGPMLAVVDAD